MSKKTITIEFTGLEYEILKAAAKTRSMTAEEYAKAILVFFAGGSMRANQKQGART